MNQSISNFSFVALLATFGFGLPLSLQAQSDQDTKSKPSKSKTEFLRIRTDDGVPQALQTSVTRYQTEDGRTVDLIGAVHVGEGSYYKKLNEVFDNYDVLLYELVAEEGTVIPKGGKRDTSNPLSFLQGGMQSMLGLESQLAKVDYTKKHFKRADMTPRQMADKMAENGDSPLTLALSAFTESIRKQNKAMADAEKRGESPEDLFGLGGDGDLMSLFDTFGNPSKMKLMMAKTFTATGSLDGALGGSLQKLLVEDRNKVAMEELKKQLKRKRKIGLFYGAAHMPDFEKRLVSELKMKKVKHEWIDAWDLKQTETKRKRESDPTKLLFKLLEDLSK